MKSEHYFELIKRHYYKIWHSEPKIYLWNNGPIEKLNFDFRVLEFSPTSRRNMWTYTTCCMSSSDDQYPIELHIFSEHQDESIIELLTSIAYYSKNTHPLNLWHTINFGRSWQDKSICEYGLISLPYLDGQALENLNIEPNREKCVKFYWLIPITKQEVDYKKEYGIEALEQLFEQKSFDYLDPGRKSVV